MDFTKYHGCGNDFIIIDYEENIDYSLLAKKLCNRNIGIGADGLIIAKNDPLEMMYYNSDGSISPMCGNGIRCFSRYVYENGLVNLSFDVKTLAGIYHIEILDTKNFLVKVNMGLPSFNNTDLKINDSLDSLNRKITINNKDYLIHSLFIGTIHTLIFVNDFKIADELGEIISSYPIFTEKTNVNFVKIIDDLNVEIKTYERGVGFTNSCGTGACATYAFLRLIKKITSLTVHLKYGYLCIEGDKDIYMTGPAEKIFTGSIDRRDINGFN